MVFGWDGLTDSSLPPSLSPSLQLTCTAVGLPVDCDSSTCLWVCCSDGYGGQVCLLDLEQSTRPQLVANITISDSKILCITAVPIEGRRELSLLNGSVEDEPEGPVRTSKGDEVIATASISSSDSSSELSHASVSRTHSSRSSTAELRPPSLNGSIFILGEEDKDENGLREGESEEKEERPDRDSSCNSPLASRSDETADKPEESDGVTSVVNGGSSGITTGDDKDKRVFELKEKTVDANLYPSNGRPSRSLVRVELRRVRSNSVPPDVERGLEETDGLLRQKRVHHRHHHGRSTRTRSPSPTLCRGAMSKNFSTKSHSSGSNPTAKLWSPLTLRPSNSFNGRGDWEGLADKCMWLGTEGGHIHIYGAGDNLRARSHRRTVELPAPVHCIR